MRTVVRHFALIALSLVVTMAIFIFLPFSYYSFHNKLYDTLNGRKVKRVALDSLSILKPTKKKHLQRREKSHAPVNKFKSFSDTLKLDLSVLSDGTGEGLFAGNGSTVIQDFEADEPPLKRVIVQPEYPRKAREEGVECAVKIKILIDETGMVRKIIFLKVKPHWGFEEAVRDAVSQWRFQAAQKDNLPVSVWARQEIDFSL